MQTIAIFGATGMLGTPVANYLVSNGFHVRALVRNAKAAGKKLDSRIQLLEGDLRNSDDVKHTLQGADVVYISLNVPVTVRPSDYNPELEGTKSILLHARESGVQHVLYLSSLLKDYGGFDWWVFEMKNEVERLVLNSGLKTTVFYPCAFMEVMPERQLQGNKLMMAGRSKVKTHFISAEDYARMVASAIRLGDAAAEQYVIQGPEYVKVEEALNVFAKYYPHRELKVQSMPMWLFKFLGNFNRSFGFAAKITSALLNKPDPFKGESAWNKLGQPTTTLIEFAKNYPPIES